MAAWRKLRRNSGIKTAKALAAAAAAISVSVSATYQHQPRIGSINRARKRARHRGNMA